MMLLTHAGASFITDPCRQKEEMDAVERAASLGGSEPTPRAAVVRAVQFLENHPMLDAGTGSLLQLDGRIRMDAGVADSEGGYGAVLQIEQVANPVAVAERLLTLSYHAILSGDGATQFAMEEGFPREMVHTRHRLERFLEERGRVPTLTYRAVATVAADHLRLGTVGAVARDETGRLASANSTGGLGFGYPGRVGDTALLGMGLFCSEEVAIACTGHGEAIIRAGLANSIAQRFHASGDLAQSCQQALASMTRAAGIIALSRDGQWCRTGNTPFLPTALWRQGAIYNE